MTTNRALTLRLELADGKPITGSLCDERGNEHRFASWLGLLTLLEQARRTGVAIGNETTNNAVLTLATRGRGTLAAG